MNDIPRGTPRTELIDCLMGPRLGQHKSDQTTRPDVEVAIAISDSRLDDELSVATIEFNDTLPKWLQFLNIDSYGFPKKMAIGTLWRGVDKNAVDKFGRTQYIRAVMQGGLSILHAEMLAEFEDTDVNTQDNEGRTALHWACAEGLSDMVKLCLSVPECDIGVRDHDGLTAFDIALRRAGGNEMIPNLFYTNMLELEDTQPQTALLRALTITSEPAQDKPTFPGAAIFTPIAESNQPLIAALIKRGINLNVRNEDGDTPLHLAAGRDLGMVTSLLEAGSDINARGRWGATPLHHAARATDKGMVQVLLDWNADITLQDMDGGSVVDWAIENEQYDVGRLLLNHGASAGASFNPGRMTLRLAEQQRKSDLVRSHIPGTDKEEQTGVKMVEVTKPYTVQSILHPRGQQWMTRLQIAAVSGNLNNVRNLLSSGVDLESTDEGDRTALHMAVMTGNAEIVKTLLSGGAEIEAASFGGLRALHLAVQAGNVVIVDALLELGADREAICWNQQTALHLAARRGLTGIVEILIARLALVDARSDDGTPLQLALKNGHTETVNALQAYGAKRTPGQVVNDLLERFGLKDTPESVEMSIE